MIRIDRLFCTVLPADRERVQQVQAIFTENFPEEAAYAAKIPDQIDHPFKYGYQAVLLVSITPLGRVTGFSLLFLLPEINAALLDFIAVTAGRRGSGIGTALYEATREFAKGSGCRGIYFEAAPADPALEPDPARQAQNARRLAFYARYGARPIVGTDYETPIGASAPPHLLFDALGNPEPLRRAEARAAVRLILTRKYARLLPAGYIERVVESFVDDPVRFQPPAGRTASRPRAVRAGRLRRPFVLVSSDRHAVHHVHDHGYVERPARVNALRDALVATGLFDAQAPHRHSESCIRSLHAGHFVRYLKLVCLRLQPDRPVYPYVFPIRRPDKRPRDLATRAGYYCIDTFTPLDRHAYEAACAAVDVALTAGDALVRGAHVVYALCRPPGHHAGVNVFGGFCYFNNAAIVAQRLCGQGRVAVLDIDFHHGNGTQDIFYERDDVLTVSIHGHPNYAYPYFSGFADERGAGKGTGFNLNLPLPETADAAAYLAAFDRAVRAVRRFDPVCLVVSLGFDTMRGDPTGAFGLRAGDMEEIGRRLAALGLPLCFVQEGGYNLRNLRAGAPALFRGVAGELDRGSNGRKENRS